MPAVVSLDRQADCPSCGATVTFKFAGARSVVCEYCKSVVARTDRGVAAQGRMADLLDIPAPLPYGQTGQWAGEPFEVTGAVQMDRAGQAGAPWQEMLVWFPMRDTTSWVAYAQGRWYATSEVPQPPPLPPFESLRPGSPVDLGQYGSYVVQEVAQRRVVSGQGSLPNVPQPGVITRYADISGPGGAFGTIDYGDGRTPPTLFVGRMFDPTQIKLDSGMPLEAPQAQVAAADCPNCGASLPILSAQAERVVCQYCGTASDMQQGHLSALGPSPRPPIEPFIPIGAKGNFRGNDYIVCGFVIRSCVVEGEVYSWREYLLYGGDMVGYRWLMEEDGNWQFVEPIEAGDVLDSGSSAMFRGGSYHFKQQVQAKVDYVVGEFYWKVEIGETVEATEFQGPGGKVSREKSRTEVTYSLCSPVSPGELSAFGVTVPTGSFMGGDASGGSTSSMMVIIVVIIMICLICSVMMGDCGGGGAGVPVFGGSGFGK